MGGVLPNAESSDSGWRSLAGRILLAVATVAAAVAVASVFLRRYPDGQPVLTRDIPHYLWRARLVTAEGVGALVSWHPAHLGIQAERPGLLALLGLVHVADV